MARSSSAVQVQQKLPAGARTPAKNSITSEAERLKIIVSMLASEATLDERHEYFTQIARRMSPASLKRAVENLASLCEKSNDPKLQDAHKEAQELREILERELKPPKPQTPKRLKGLERREAEIPVVQKVASISPIPRPQIVAPQKTATPKSTPAPTPAPTPLTGKEEVAQAREKMKSFGPAGRPTRYVATPKDDCDLTTALVPADGKVEKPPWPGTWTPSVESEKGSGSGTKRHTAHGKYGAD